MSEIVAKEISFRYGDYMVFESASFSIEKGELWALVGRSGTGKSSLLQVLAGLFRADSGVVEVAGAGIAGPGVISGVVFQEDSLLGWLTVLENVLFPFQRGARGEEEARAKALLADVGLSGWEYHQPRELSSGMRKRVEFARALYADADYFLADEPFAAVDALTRQDLWELWRRLRNVRPRTGVIATHDPEEAVRLCDGVIPLRPGRPNVCGPQVRFPAELREVGPNVVSPLLEKWKRQVLELLERPT